MNIKFIILLLIPITNAFQFNILDTKVNDIVTMNKMSSELHKPGVFIVRKISSMLPHVDSIGHNVLHANNEFISTIFENDNIPYDQKKNIILISIKLAQFGDDLGSHLLQLYYDIVNHFL